MIIIELVSQLIKHQRHVEAHLYLDFLSGSKNSKFISVTLLRLIRFLKCAKSEFLSAVKTLYQ